MKLVILNNSNKQYKINRKKNNWKMKMKKYNNRKKKKNCISKWRLNSIRNYNKNQ